MPIFLSTYREGKTGGGYDVGIAGNIYFQFKIPKYYDKVSNFSRRRWDVFGGPHYKVKIDTDHKQFDLLKKLKKSNNQVLYAMPDFYESTELEKNYRNDNIFSSSSRFPIENFPSFNSGFHELIYHPNFSYGKLFSEPVEIGKYRVSHPLEMFQFEGDRSTIYDEALRIFGVLMRNDHFQVRDLPFHKDQPELFVKEIYATLLNRFNIHWHPISLS